MSLRKERNHCYGYSNIDFRSKRDDESLQLFQPWKVRKAFGTMGYTDYKIDPDNKKKLLLISDNINNQRTIYSEIPDPKYYKTARYYYNNKIPLKEKTEYTNERIAQLDETAKGKEIFTGDSMMISDINKSRKQKGFQDKAKINKNCLNKMIIKDKHDKNKEAFQETQLVRTHADVTLEDKIDINKVKDIRLTLRRRYAHRGNLRKIFKDWDISGRGEINLYDVHTMINQMGIPINYNESLALIASSNERQTQSLNLKEFMHLIFNDNSAIDIDLKKIEFKDEKLYDEGIQLENLKNNMRQNISEMSKTNDVNYFRDYFRIRIPTLVKYLNESCETDKQSAIDFNSFHKVIKKFPINEKYTREQLVRAIFNQFILSDSDKMDIKSFINNIIDTKEVNDFYNFKERYISNIKEKMSINSDAVQESINLLNANEKSKKLIAKELELDILNHKKKQIIEEKKEILNPVPSTEFINKMFYNKDFYFQKHKEIEQRMSAHPSLLKEIQAKTRYGANPPHQNTFTIIQAPKEAAIYISEKERFNNGKSEVEKDREKKKLKEIHKIQKLKEENSRISHNAYMKDYLYQEKDIYSQLQRTKKLYQYENVNLLRNTLIE